MLRATATSRRRAAPVVALAVAASLAACAESTGPRAPGGSNKSVDPRQLVLDSVSPAGQTLSGRLGLTFSVRFADTTIRVAAVTVYVDSGTPRQRKLDAWLSAFSSTASPASVPAYADTAGDHVFTVVATGTSPATGGFVASTRFTRTFTVPAATYTAAALPDLGAGAGVRSVSAGGVVTGWVADNSGRRQAAIWKNGALSVLSAQDTVDVIAVQTNAAGDVLLQPSAPPNVTGFYGPIRILRADGTTLVPRSVGGTSCCITAAALNDRREVLASSDPGYQLPPGWAYESAVYDVVTGAVTDSVPQNLRFRNNAGQMLGLSYSTEGFGYDSYTPLAVGFTLPPYPTLAAELPGCDLTGQRWSQIDALGLDDDANVLVNNCGNVAFLGAGGGAWMNQYLGAAVAGAVLSRQGTWVVGLNATTGTLYRWQATTQTTQVVSIAGGPWVIDSLGDVNASGQIAAHGVNKTTSVAAALLLTPAP